MSVRVKWVAGATGVALVAMYSAFHFRPQDRLTEGSILGFVSQDHGDNAAVFTSKGGELCLVQLGTDRVDVNLRRFIPHRPFRQAIAFHPREPRLALSFFDVEFPASNAAIISTSDGSELSSARVHEGLVTAVHFNRNRDELVTAGTAVGRAPADYDAFPYGRPELAFWNSTLSTASRSRLQLYGLVYCISSSSVSELIAIGGEHGKVQVWRDSNLEDVATWTEVWTEAPSVHCIQFTADGTGLLVAGGHGVSIRDVHSGTLRYLCKSRGDCFSAVLVDRDEKLVAFVDEEGLWAWNTQSGMLTLLRSIFRREASTFLVAASESGHFYFALDGSIEYLAIPVLADER